MIGSNATTARIRLALEGQGQVVRGLQEVQAGIGGMRSAMASLAGGLSLGAAVGQLVQVQREMDVLNASMVTVTGSSRAASTEMEWIKRFAAQTPYQLNEVTGAFVKMKALGLDASEKALRSYGNTASAMGKDLNQFIEAVADAATGEFERLKEFGIKAKKEGDSVSFTFQGVTTQLRNNAADITTYLQAIGNTEFAGAMDRRVASLDGAISNLGDSWEELARTVNEAGVGNLIETSVRGATAAISGLAATIRENKTELAVLAGGLGGAALVATLPKVGAGLMIVAGGVKALGLALAANPLTLALLGIGAAVGGFMAYNNAVAKTREGMERTIRTLEDTNRSVEKSIYGPPSAAAMQHVEARRKQIAALRQELALLGSAGLDTRAEDARLGRYAAPAAAAAAARLQTAPVGTASLGAKASQAADEFARLKDQLTGSLADAYAKAQAAAQGLNNAQTDFLRLANSPEWSTLTDSQRQQVAGLFETRIATEQAAKSVQDLAAANEQATRAYVDSLRPFETAAASAQERVAAMEAENQALALSESLNISLARAVEMTAIARLKEAQALEMAKGAGMDDARVLAIQAEIDARQQLVDLMAGRDVKEASKALREREAQEWQRTWDQVGQSFTDALMAGGKSVAQYLKDLFRTLVLRPILAPVGSTLASALMPGAANAGGLSSQGSGGGSEVLGTIGQLAGIGGSLGTGIAAGFANALTGTFAGSLTAAGSLIGTGSVAGVSAGIGMGIGTIAPYALAALAVYKLLTAETPGEQHRGGFYSSTGATGLEGAARITGSGANSGQARDLIDRADPGLTSQVQQTADSLLANVGAMAKAIGSQVALGLDLGFAANLNGQAGNNNAFGYFGVSANGQLVDTYQNRELGSDAAKAYATLTEEAASALAEVVLGSTGLVRTGESAYQALQRLSGSLQTVNQVFDTLGLKAYQVGLAGGDMASSLADLFGGLDAFTQASTAYYQAFYSEGERTATTTRQLTAALAGLGLQLPETRQAYRELVEAQDLTTEAGRSAYAALVQLAPTFAELAPSVDDLAASAANLQQALQQAGDSVAEEIRRLRGLNTTASADGGLAALQARFATATASARAGSTSALAELPAITQALEEAARLQATTAAELALLRSQTAASLALTMSGLGLQVPAFEVGTNYVPRTMLAQVHEGEAIVPKAYNPAAGGAAPGSDAMATELRALRQEVAQMRTESGAGFTAVATHTAKTARILERAQPTGDALLTMTQAELSAL